jgi:putative transposase
MRAHYVVSLVGPQANILGLSQPNFPQLDNTRDATFDNSQHARSIVRFTDGAFDDESQIVGILKDAESGVPVADLLRKYGVSKATFFKWRNKYGGASVSDVKRLRELETENAKLKRMYADLALENAAIKDVLNRKL